MEYSTCIYFAYIPVQKEKFCEWSRHSSPINFKYRLRKPAISSTLDDFHWLLKSKHVSIWGPWFNGTADRAWRFPPKLQKQIVRSIYSAVESRNTRLSTGLRINILKFIGATLTHARQALLKKEKKENEMVWKISKWNVLGLMIQSIFHICQLFLTPRHEIFQSFEYQDFWRRQVHIRRFQKTSREELRRGPKISNGVRNNSQVLKKMIMLHTFPVSFLSKIREFRKSIVIYSFCKFSRDGLSSHFWKACQLWL